MGLFTSLYTGVNGMTAQSQATANISNNIANSTTIGFKKTDTAFHDLVVNNTRPANFANGGVFTHQVQRIDRQGQLQQSAVATELGISGAGFFAVKSTDDPNMEFLYTRNGTFSPDSNGLLRNAAGFILYGWPVNTDGTVASGNTLESLQAVDINELDATHRATAQAEFSVNLDASQTAINPQTLTGPLSGSLPVSEQSMWDPITETVTNNSTEAHFTRNLTVVDNSGTPRDLVFEFRHISGPMAQATSQISGLAYETSFTDPDFFPTLAAGDTFTIGSGSGSQEYIIGAAPGPNQVRVDTIGDLTGHVNTQLGDPDPNDGMNANVIDVILNEEGRLVFKAVDPNADLTFSGAAMTGSSLAFNASYNPLADVTVSDPAINPDQGDFPPIGNLTDPNTNGWWEVRILKEPDPGNPAYIEDPLSPGSLIPNPDPLAGQPIEISKALLNFDGQGRINTPRDPVTGAIINSTLNVNPGTFDSSHPDGTANLGEIPIDMSRFSQFAGAYNVIIQSHDGAEAGTLTGVDVTRDGRVIASFTNGEEFEIFQVPLANFINPNGLEARTGTVFAATQDAGEVEILEAGSGGAGAIQAATVEASNVDIADEFANLIVTQRAFSANSRVVNTVDEMTQQLRALKQ